MNNNLRKILSIAACAAVIGCGNSVGICATTTVPYTITSGTHTGDGSSGKVYQYTWEFDGQTWTADNANSVRVDLSGGQLTVKNYSSAVQNGLIRATGGTLKINNGVLTLGEGSSVKNDTTIQLDSEAAIGVTGGSLYVDSGDSLLGAIVVVSGSLDASAGTNLKGGLTSRGNVTLNNSVVEGISLQGGRANITNTKLNKDIVIQGGTNNIENSTFSVTTEILGGDTTIKTSTMEDVEVSGGSTKFVNTTINGTYSQTGGVSTFAGDSDIANASVTGSTINIGDGSSANIDIKKSEISSDSIVNIRNNATLNVQDSDITLGQEDNWTGNINLQSGHLALVGINKSSNGIFKQTGGNTTVSGATPFYLNNERDDISGGTFSIGTETTKGTVNVTRGTISSGAQVNINESGILDIKGGKVTLDSNDYWAGIVGVTGGNLEINNVTKATDAIFIQTNGTTTLKSDFELSNIEDSIEGGTLNVGGDSISTKFTVNGATIYEDAQINLDKNSKINIRKGEVSLDSGDNWNGHIELNNGTLNLNNVSKTGRLTQNNGVLNVTGKKFDLNDGSDLINGGQVNIGSSGIQSKMTVSKGSIGEDAAVNISSSGTLDITGGNVALDGDTSWAGTVNLSDGNFSISDVRKTGTYNQTGGNAVVIGNSFHLNNSNDIISGGNFTIGNSASSTVVQVGAGAITNDARIDITNNATLDIVGGGVELGSDDTWSGNVSLKNGSLTLNSVTKSPLGSFKQTSGKTNVIGNGFDLNSSDDRILGGTLNIGDKVTETTMTVSVGKIDSAAIVNIHKNATLNIAGSDINLDSSDSWAGDINMYDGNLELNGINKTSTGKYIQTGGTTTLANNQFDLNNREDSIAGGNLNINNSILNVTAGNIESGAKVNLAKESTINVDGGKVSIGNVDTWDGTISVTDGNLYLDGVSDKVGILDQKRGTTTVTRSGFDLNNVKDSITGGTLNIGDGTVLSDMTVSKGIVGSNVVVNINEKGTLNINGGTVNLGKDGTWKGDVQIAAGDLSVVGKSKNEDGKFVQTGGTTTITDTDFNLNNSQDLISGGTLKIGNGTSISTFEVSKGTIAQDASVVLNKNATLKVSGSNVVIDKNDTWNGTVDVAGGSLALVGITKNAGSVLKQTSGETTITGVNAFDFNNVEDNIDGGVLNFGDGSQKMTITVSQGTIGKDAILNIGNQNTLNVTGGNVTLDSATDNFNGSVNISNGNLYLDGMNKNAGVLTQTGGNLTVVGTGSTLSNDADKIQAGNLLIGTEDRIGELNVYAGTIEQKAEVTIAQGSALNIKGGVTTLDKVDKWEGDVNLTNGTLNFTNNLDKVTTEQSKFTQSGGTLNLDNSKLTLNNFGSKLTGGTVNISKNGELVVNNLNENKSTLKSSSGKLSIESGKYTIAEGSIDEASRITVNEGGTFAVDGEDVQVTIDGANDLIDGHLEITSGNVDIKNGFIKETTTAGTYRQTGGTANIKTSTVHLNDAGSIVSGGEINVSDNSEFSVNNGKKHSSRLNVSGSKFGIRNGSTYEIKGGKIDDKTQVSLASTSKLEINGSDAEVNLNGTSDVVTGTVELKNGSLYISDDLTKVTTADGQYIQSGGKATLKSSTLTLADSKSRISGGDIALTDNSVLTVTKSGGAAITGGNISIDNKSVMNYLANGGLVQTDGNEINITTGGLINLANNVRTNSSINSLTINNSANNSSADFVIDFYARSNDKASSDTITANAINATNSGREATIRISDWNINGDVMGYDAPIDRNIRLGKIFKSDDIGSEVQFTSTDKEIFTPIGYYRLNASDANDGNYSLDLASFNPQVFRGQVATAASFMNQLVINDTLFNRAQIRRYGASYDELFKNKTALIEGNAIVERTIKDGGLWTEMFGNFETLKMSRGLDKVRNNSYGFIVGADFGMKNIKNGWRWMPTAYVAYNGAHQTFEKVGMYENGVQLGFMGSFYKKKFTETALLYGGAYRLDMDVAGHSDDTYNYFVGLASKSAYDWRLGRHFTVQPNLALAYNMFGKQSWNTAYGQMHMSSGFLNGFNLAPGVNLIWQQESWSMYAQLAYTWNYFGVDGRAGYVDLPNVKMSHGFLTWGFGMTKSFSDRMMMYAQATVRNIGRTGIICSGGINWKF